MNYRRVDREATDAIKAAADKMIEAADKIINCMSELKPELKSLSKRNYREIQISTNSVKQLVSINFATFFEKSTNLSKPVAWSYTNFRKA